MRQLPVLALWLIASCGGSTNKDNSPVSETALVPGKSTESASSSPSTQIQDGGVSPDDTTANGIQRSALRAVLSNGPAGVLSMVETAPVRKRNGQFIGFKITQFINGEPKVIDLHAGDILVAVNGQKIVAPDDYFRVYQELSVASELRFDIIRADMPLTLSYPIVD